MKIKFEKPKLRKNMVGIRATDETVKKLKKLCEKYGVTQADIIEKLIEKAE